MSAAGSPESAEAIVRALADRDPIDNEEWACGLCLRTLGSDHYDPDYHAELCLWVLARRWVLAREGA